MREHPLAFIDLETTGLVPQRHELIEIAYVIVSQPDFTVMKEHVMQIKPLHLDTADQEALRIIHFDKRDWSGAISRREAMTRFAADVKGCIMVGQNITVDWSFLREALSEEQMNDPMHYHRLDVMSIAYGLLKDEVDIRKFSLKELVDYFHITVEHMHSALDDTKATFEVYKKLLAYRDRLSLR